MTMSKYIYNMVVGCVALMLTAACHEGEIPAQAQAFLEQHFGHYSIVLVEVGTDEGEGGEKEYKVWLNDGAKVEFDMQGNWKRVGRKKTGIPTELIPDAIERYVKQHYPHDVVTKFSKKDYGYKLELSDDMDLRFTKACQFIEEID